MKKLILCIMLVAVGKLPAEEKKDFLQFFKEDLQGSVSMTYMLDERHFTSNGFGSMINKLPWGLSMLGLTEFYSDHNDASAQMDMDRTFSEYRITESWLGPKIGIKGLGLQLEYNQATPVDFKLGRAGISYFHTFKSPWKTTGWANWRWFPVETDGEGGQLSFAFEVPITKKLFLGGYFDWDYGDKDPDYWVCEPELLYRVNKHFAFAVEYRYNDYERRIPGIEGRGWAFGIRLDW